MNIISEQEFRKILKERLVDLPEVKSVTGPGRSGAVSAVYASYALEIPFIPYGQPIPKHLCPTLIIDTTIKTGRTIRKATKKYEDSVPLCLIKEPPRVHFWYEFLRDN